MSDLFKIKTPKMPEPQRMLDAEDASMQLKRRQEEMKRMSRGGREKMNLGNVESGAGKEYGSTILGGQ